MENELRENTIIRIVYCSYFISTTEKSSEHFKLHRRGSVAVTATTAGTCVLIARSHFDGEFHEQSELDRIIIQ